MEIQNIQRLLNSNYDISAQSIELLREGGSISYDIFGDGHRYFLKIIRPPFLETAQQSIDIQTYLQDKGFPVIPIIRTKAGSTYVRVRDEEFECLFVLHDYIEGGEPLPEETEEIGELIGKLHILMNKYKGKLLVRDRYFFIERYIEILRKKQYPKSEDFSAHGNELWERVKGLPRGYCHCDLYPGNIHRASDGKKYVVDFETSCIGFPMYDAVLFCNATDYFDFSEDGYIKANAKLDSFLTGYMRHCPMSREEISAFYVLIAVYHFQLQATILEVFGYDACDFEFFDRQYDWLLKWKEQCRKMEQLKDVL